MPSVFISYRRSDTAGHAGHLASDLIARFGRSGVFMDIDSIGPGADFAERIRRALAGSDVTLVLIGDTWAGDREAEDERRIDDPGDFIRLEVGSALAHNSSAVVPVLVEGAQMPGPGTLPSDVADITRLNALQLTNSRWDYDVARIVELVESRAHVSAPRRLMRRLLPRRLRVPALAAAGVLLAAVAIVLATRSSDTPKVDAGKKVAACEAAHAMTAQAVRRAPRRGESAISSSDGTNASQTSFATCNWPPAKGADADGYRAITVTSVANPEGGGEATGDSSIDRIESSCKQFELTYAFGSQGAFQNLPPFQPLPGEVWKYNPAGDPSHAFGRINPFNRAVYPLPNEVQVERSNKVTIVKASCLR